MINEVRGLKLISLLNGDSESRRFVIPEYQRDYKWRKEEISQFMTDIFEAYDDYKLKKDYNYFFGAVITEKQTQPSEPGIIDYHLIDGQQRITTSILFIKLLQEKYKEEVQIDIENEDVVNLLVDFRRSLWVNGKEKDKMCKLISKKDGDSSNLEGVLTNTPTNVEHNFCKNYALLGSEFQDSLKGQSNFQLYDFIQFVFNNLEFVQVDTNSRESALKIFSVLNTRGLDLSSTDIIKAEAMASLPQSKHRDFFAKWKELEQGASDLDISLETLFRYYINMYRPSSIKGTNDSNIKDIWNEGSYKENKMSALADFEKFVQCFKYIWDMNDAYIWCLRHLLVLGKNAYTWIPVLVTMRYNNYSDADIRQAARFITKWHWIHLIYGWTVEKVKSFNFNLTKLVKEGKSIEDILKQEPRIITHDENDKDGLLNNFSSKLKEIHPYYAKWGRPLLFFLHNLEILKHDGCEQSFIFKELTKDDTVEHIKPQNPSDNKWIQCSENKTHVLGNLSILNRQKNSKVGTSLDKKSKEYLRVMYAFTPELSESDPWSDSRIDARSQELANVICDALDIPCPHK